MGEYRQGLTAEANARAATLRAGKPTYNPATDPTLLRADELHKRGYGPGGQSPRGTGRNRASPEYTPIQISRALVNVPLTGANGEPLPESQRHSLAIQWLDTHNSNRPPRSARVVPPLPPPR